LIGILNLNDGESMGIVRFPNRSENQRNPTIHGREHHIGDGGFVDWTQQLLENKKERMLISAIGLDRLLMP
jgi:hypothetical protein